MDKRLVGKCPKCNADMFLEGRTCSCWVVFFDMWKALKADACPINFDNSKPYCPSVGLTIYQGFKGDMVGIVLQLGEERWRLQIQEAEIYQTFSLPVGTETIKVPPNEEILRSYTITEGLTIPKKGWHPNIHKHSKL